MDAQRWQRIKTILDEASGQPRDVWPAFVAAACGDDDELRKEVHSLLAYHGQEPEIVGRPVFDVNTEDPRIGTRIGNYRILRQLGRGGMGVVYLATREEDFSQRVAIKLIQRGLGSAERIARFHEERQILADLDHPAIARLFDGGTTDDDLPFLVMELVEGKPIDAYCDNQRLDVHRRLELFRQVLSAIQTSHRHLVVHRDLKPSNILVTAEGHLKLIDFGIAKLLSSASEASRPTAPQHRQPMSPGYASPEQVRGERITTTSDVYTLGLVLCELLCGSKPYRIDTVDAAELQRVICDTAPEPPSQVLANDLDPHRLADMRATTPEKLRRQLAGELDAIVLESLAKDPESRYRSAEEMSDDLGRYLAGLPVRALSDSFAYRTKKFIQRRPMTLLATLLALVAFAGILSSFIQRSQVLDQRARAEAVEDFVGTLFRASDPDRAEGEELTVRELLDRGGDDLKAGLDDQPLVRAALTAVVGRVYQNLGNWEKAETHLTEALALQRRFDPGDDATVARRANDLAVVLRLRGKLAEAELLYREALDRIGGCRSRHPDSLYITSNLALLLTDTGKLEEAEALISCRLENRGPRPQDAETATVLNKLAVLRYRQGRLEEAAALFREVLVIRLGVNGREHTRFAATLNNLGKVYLDMGEYEGAEDALRLAVEIRRKLLGDEHPHTVNSKGHLAAVLAELERRNPSPPSPLPPRAPARPP